MAVRLAVMLVQWFTSGAVRRSSRRGARYLGHAISVRLREWSARTGPLPTARIRHVGRLIMLRQGMIFAIIFNKFYVEIIDPNWVVHMPRVAGSSGTWAGRGSRPGGGGLAGLVRVRGAELHGLDPDQEEEPREDAAPWDVDLDAIIAECREVTAEEAALAARAAARGLPGGTPVAEGRRGPGQPGSAERRAGEFASRAAGFGAGMLLDVMPGCGALAGFAAEAAGDDDRYEDACDDEVAGAISAWDRVKGLGGRPQACRGGRVHPPHAAPRQPARGPGAVAGELG